MAQSDDKHSPPPSKASRPEASSRASNPQSPHALSRLPLQHLFGAFCVLLFAYFHWPLRWLLSGAPLLTYCLLLGESSNNRVLPFVPLWPLIIGINFAYTIAGTSWLFFWVFTLGCYPMIFICSLYQFDSVATFTRRRLRGVLNNFHFSRDVVGLFDLPALEIDVDVQGLMCIRGITLSLSSLTIVAHGIEVGIKFTDDMEMALLVDTVTVKLFRRIDIGDVYGNVKGGEFEMTFGHLAQNTKNDDGAPLMVTDTALLVAAAESGDMSVAPTTPMVEKFTDGQAPLDVSVKGGFESTKTISTGDERAVRKYQETLDWIEKTSAITEARQEVDTAFKAADHEMRDNVLGKDQNIRAAICSVLHDKPTIPHPARQSVKVSTIKGLDFYGVRKFLHRFPMLLRLQLMVVSYFHPVHISSITVGGSGSWLQNLLSTTVFKDYAEDDAAVRNLRKRVAAWLTDANFVFQASKITGTGYVPFSPQYDIATELNLDDIMAYRTLVKQVDLTCILRLGGADARITVPSFLLPHHEHLLPPKPTVEDEQQHEENVKAADGAPKTVQAEKVLEQTRKDETNVKISAHAKLPASLDQSLLNFSAALIKATKLIEIDRGDSDEADHVSIKDVKGFRQLTKAIKTEVSTGMQRVAIDAAANDRWIAKLVGKVTRKLEMMQGDVGYSGDIPVALAVYRENADTAAKILP